MDAPASDIPSRLDRPRRVFREIRDESRRDNIVLVAAGVAFYAVLAVIPALVIAVSLYGLFTDIDEAERQIEAMLEVLPGSTSQIVETQMRSIARTSPASLSIGFVVSLVAFAWTVSNATRAIVRGVKIAYDQENEQSLLERRDIALGTTLVGIVSLLAALALVAAVPIWLRVSTRPTRSSRLGTSGGCWSERCSPSLPVCCTDTHHRSGRAGGPTSFQECSLRR